MESAGVSETSVTTYQSIWYMSQKTCMLETFGCGPGPCCVTGADSCWRTDAERQFQCSVSSCGGRRSTEPRSSPPLPTRPSSLGFSGVNHHCFIVPYPSITMWWAWQGSTSSYPGSLSWNVPFWSDTGLVTNYESEVFVS